MSEEVKDKEQISENLMMYVHQINYQTLLNVLEKVTDVHMSFVYTMPKKAISYKDDGFSLIKELDLYANSDQDWRINKQKNIQLRISDNKIIVGEWVLHGSELILCIPRINSLIIIPNEQSTYKGTKEPTKILQLTNCISVTPLLLVFGDEVDSENPEKYRLSIGYELIKETTQK